MRLWLLRLQLLRLLRSKQASVWVDLKLCGHHTFISTPCVRTGRTSPPLSGGAGERGQGWGVGGGTVLCSSRLLCSPPLLRCDNRLRRVKAPCICEGLDAIASCICTAQYWISAPYVMQVNGTFRASLDRDVYSTPVNGTVTVNASSSVCELVPRPLLSQCICCLVCAAWAVRNRASAYPGRASDASTTPGPAGWPAPPLLCPPGNPQRALTHRHGLCPHSQAGGRRATTVRSSIAPTPG